MTKQENYYKHGNRENDLCYLKVVLQHTPKNNILKKYVWTQILLFGLEYEEDDEDSNDEEDDEKRRQKWRKIWIFNPKRKKNISDWMQLYVDVNNIILLCTRQTGYFIYEHHTVGIVL